MRPCFPVLLAAAFLWASLPTDAQVLSGSLVGTVKDEHGAVLRGALVRVSSPALIGGPATMTTNERGQLRFPILPPGTYALDIELPGFATYHEVDVTIGVGATLERTVVLTVAGIAESVVVEGSGARIEARSSGFETRFKAGGGFPSNPDTALQHDRFHQGCARRVAYVTVERFRPVD